MQELDHRRILTCLEICNREHLSLLRKTRFLSSTGTRSHQDWLTSRKCLWLYCLRGKQKVLPVLSSWLDLSYKKRASSLFSSSSSRRIWMKLITLKEFGTKNLTISTKAYLVFPGTGSFDFGLLSMMTGILSGCLSLILESISCFFSMVDMSEIILQSQDANWFLTSEVAISL